MSDALHALIDLLDPPKALVPGLQTLKEELSVGDYALQVMQWGRQYGQRKNAPDLPEDPHGLLKKRFEHLTARAVDQPGQAVAQVHSTSLESLRDAVKTLELRERTDAGLSDEEREELADLRGRLKTARSEAREELLQTVETKSVEFRENQAKAQVREAEQKRNTILPIQNAHHPEVGGIDMVDP